MSFGQPTQNDEKVALAPTVQPPSYQITTEPPYPPPGDAESGRPVHRRRRFRRFCHFFFATLFIWVTVRHVIRHCEMRRFGPPHFGGIHEGPDFGLAIPRTRPGESIDSCVESADWTEVDPLEPNHPHGFSVWQRAELSLPTDADDIFLLSRGVHAFGHLEIIEAADREDIGVEVVVGYHDDSDLFERSSVCTLRRGDNGHGIGIFTPRFDHRHHERERDLIFFNITLSLPEGKEVTTVPHFETRLPLFSQIVTELPTYAFGSISLHSTNRPILAYGLVGDKISIRSRNGPIEGMFNTSSSLVVETSNTPVKVVVNAFNQNSSAPTNVKISTSNSILSADLSLISTFENSTSGSFTVVTRTSNSPLEVNFSDHAPDGLLKLDAHTSNSPVEIRLHPSFEGTFKLRTSVFSATVSPDLEVVDPAGRDRKRSVNVSTIGRYSRIIHGDVAWKPEDEALKPDSKVEVSTSNSPLHVWL